MRLIVLISIAALIAVAAIGSYIHYRSWSAGRLDAMIAEAAEPYGIEPALLRAVVEEQVRNVVPEEIGRGESRWGLIPHRVGDLYLKEHNRQGWRYICPQRRFPNHDPSKPEEFTSEPVVVPGDKPKQTTCQARGCGQPLVYELHELRTNLEVVAWFLADRKSFIEKRDKVQHRSRDPRELRALMIITYRWGLPPDLDHVRLTDEQSAYVRAVERAYAAYREKLKPSATGGRTDAPSAPF